MNNLNSSVAAQTAPLIDYLPHGMTVAGNASTTCGGKFTAKKGDSEVILKEGSIPANGTCSVKVDVTAKQKGSYRNKLSVGALKTNKGSNTTEAVATLTVTK